MWKSTNKSEMIDEFKVIDKIIERMNAINRNEIDKNSVEFKTFNYSYYKIRVRRCIRNRRNRWIRFRIRNHSSEFINYSLWIDRNDCKIDTTDLTDETLANVSEIKDVKCNNIYLNILKLKIDFRKIRKHFVT